MNWKKILEDLYCNETEEQAAVNMMGLEEMVILEQSQCGGL